MALRFEKKCNVDMEASRRSTQDVKGISLDLNTIFKTFLNNVLVCYAFKTLPSDQRWQEVKKYSLYAENYALTVY